MRCVTSGLRSDEARHIGSLAFGSLTSGSPGSRWRRGRSPIRHPICEDNRAVTVRLDCRHYTSRSLSDGDLVERCRLDVADAVPFACPDGCLFFEPRPVSDVGWQIPRDRR